MIQELMIFVILLVMIYFISKEIIRNIEHKKKVQFKKDNADKIDNENAKYALEIAYNFLAAMTEHSIINIIFKNLKDNEEQKFMSFVQLFPTNFDLAVQTVLRELTTTEAVIWIKYRYDIKIIANKGIDEEVSTIYLFIDKFDNVYDYKIVADKEGKF